jgi:hypothetical protein
MLKREVRANLVYRYFTRVGGGKMPDAKTMARWGGVLGPQVLKQIHERMVKIAQAKGVITGRRMRVDTTVVETNIHQRWFRDGEKWRIGCEGRISVAKRRHGLRRCRYNGYVGMHRWVGLGVIADNLLNIGRAIEKRADP